MRYLATALYAEGPTDYRFLLPLLRRACEDACARHASEPVEIADVLGLGDGPDAPASRQERIGQAVRQALGSWTVVFVHADADTSAGRALGERVEPARSAIEAIHAGGLVPVVPVRGTEAWALVDGDAWRTAFGTRASDGQMGLPARPADAESILDCKQAYRHAVVVAAGAERRSRRSRDFPDGFGTLAEAVSLERLARLPSWQRLQDNLLRSLRLQGFIG